MNVEISRAAEADLDELSERLLESLGWGAIPIMAKLRRACLTLAEMPLRYPLVPMHEKDGLRRRVFGNYLIFYIVGSETVTVLEFCMARKIMNDCCFPPIESWTSTSEESDRRREAA